MTFVSFSFRVLNVLMILFRVSVPIVCSLLDKSVFFLAAAQQVFIIHWGKFFTYQSLVLNHWFEFCSSGGSFWIIILSYFPFHFFLSLIMYFFFINTTIKMLCRFFCHIPTQDHTKFSGGFSRDFLQIFVTALISQITTIYWHLPNTSFCQYLLLGWVTSLAQFGMSWTMQNCA